MRSILSTQRLKELVPAAFNERVAGHLSNNYQLVNTFEAVVALRKEGWWPVSAQQKRSRSSASAAYAKHIVRFQHDTAQGIFPGGAMVVGQAFPELILVNSHNGSSPYKLLAGIFVVACTNGLIVAEEILGTISIRHLRSHEEELLNAAERISDQLKPVMGRVQAMRNRVLQREEQRTFASSAMRLKFPTDNSPFTPDQILAPRRTEDSRDDLWAVFNRVQENLLAGATVGATQGPNGRRFTSRPTRDVNVVLNLNQRLWSLADGLLSVSDN